MINLKKKEDILILREIGKNHSEILKILEKFSSPGVTTGEIDKKANILVKERGFEPAFLGYKPAGASQPFPATVCVSVNEEIVHGLPNESQYTLKEGDLVSIDLGLKHKGLITDAAITVCVGKCSKEKKDLSYKTKEALYKGIEAMSVGGSIGDIGAAISGFARKTGFSVVKHLCGHGVGYSVHEDPYVPNVNREGTGDRLEPGLVLAIEPMLTTGSGDITLLENGFTYSTKEKTPSAHWEHTVAVTEEGVKIITE